MWLTIDCGLRLAQTGVIFPLKFLLFVYHHGNHGAPFGTGTITVETTEHLSEPEPSPWKPRSIFRNRNYHRENHGVSFGTGTITVKTTEHLSEPEPSPWKPRSIFRNRNYHRGSHGASFRTGTITVESTAHLSEPEPLPWIPRSTPSSGWFLLRH